MPVYRWIYLFIFTIVLAGAACRSEKKKVSLAGEDEVSIRDFVDFFPELILPYGLADTSLAKKDNDSLLISNKVFAQFVPDSVKQMLFGKGVKPKIYPLGKVTADEQYLFVKGVHGGGSHAYVLIFDKKNNFITGAPFLKRDQVTATSQVSTFDKRYTITKNIIRANKDGSVSDGKEVLAFNSAAGELILILTDALDEKVAELVNPIDTFSRKQKYTADYGSGKNNLVSFRDGRGTGWLSFFIHFEKGDCKGELKGEARVKSATTAEYRQPGDPCIITFTFTSNSVRITEVEGCGARRGLRCSFDGLYPRKKEVKKKTK